MYLTVHAVDLPRRLHCEPFARFCARAYFSFCADFIPHGDEHLAATHFTRERVMKRLCGAALLDGIVLIIFGLIYIATTPIYNPPHLLPA